MAVYNTEGVFQILTISQIISAKTSSINSPNWTELNTTSKNNAIITIKIIIKDNTILFKGYSDDNIELYSYSTSMISDLQNNKKIGLIIQNGVHTFKNLKIKSRFKTYHDTNTYNLSTTTAYGGSNYNMQQIYECNNDFHLKVKGTNSNNGYQWNYGIGVGDTIIKNSSLTGYGVLLTGAGTHGFRYGSLANPTLDRESGDVPTNTELLYELIREGSTYRGIITRVSDGTVYLDKTITYENNTLNKLYFWVNQTGKFNITDIELIYEND